MDQPDYRRALQQRLAGLQAAGVRQLPRSTAPLSLQAPAADPVPTAAPVEAAAGTGQAAPPPPAAAPPEPAKPAAATTPSVTAPAAPSTPRQEALLPAEASVAPTLDVLQQEVVDCRRCAELARTRTQTVFGVGDPNARLCFMGEAPGADEDRLGEPFVGRAGQLLDKIIQACRMQRSDVYILNTLKCRPPGNRNPKPEESANCSGFLNRQLELIDPEFICCLGAVAAQNLLQTQTPIGRLRGSVHDYRGIKVVCTYHPAYLLRNPSAKKQTWDDMKMLMSLMGVEL